MAIGIEQFLQVGHLSAKFCALVGVGYEHAVGTHFDDDRGALDVSATLDGVFGGGEGFVLYQLEASAVVDQCIAGNARLLVVGL